MVGTLRGRKKLAPLIIVEGSRYPNSPDSSFIDGVHRSLAIAVYALRTSNDNFRIDAFVGHKASPLQRAIQRFG